MTKQSKVAIEDFTKAIRKTFHTAFISNWKLLCLEPAEFYKVHTNDEWRSNYIDRVNVNNDLTEIFGEFLLMREEEPNEYDKLISRLPIEFLTKVEKFPDISTKQFYTLKRYYDLETLKHQIL